MYRVLVKNEYTCIWLCVFVVFGADFLDLLPAD